MLQRVNSPHARAFTGTVVPSKEPSQTTAEVYHKSSSTYAILKYVPNDNGNVIQLNPKQSETRLGLNQVSSLTETCSQQALETDLCLKKHTATLSGPDMEKPAM